MITDEFKIRSYTKSSLAQLYNPEVCAASARRLLHRWINHNNALQKELEAAGYSDRARLLPPRQVGIIVKYLGKP